jgi:glyoxylase-like metal-dependent hydrolase (beta-lactamase superfamily II)
MWFVEYTCPQGIEHREIKHDRADAPSRAHGRCGNRCWRNRVAKRYHAGECSRGAAGQASARLLSLQSWLVGSDRRHRRRTVVPVARQLRQQCLQRPGKRGSGTGIHAQDKITLVFNYHQDHVDGLLAADNSPAFPNAEIMVPAAEHKFWMDDGEMSRAPKGRMEGLFKNNRRIFSGGIAKRLKLYDSDKEIAPGITAVSTPGHTVGHTSYVIASGNDRVFVFSDVTNRPELFVRNPGWHAFFDQIPDMAEQSRRKTLDMLVADKMIVQTFHAPFPGNGYMEKDGASYRFVPARWNPAI